MFDDYYISTMVPRLSFGTSSHFNPAVLGTPGLEDRIDYTRRNVRLQNDTEVGADYLLLELNDIETRFYTMSDRSAKKFGPAFEVLSTGLWEIANGNIRIANDKHYFTLKEKDDGKEYLAIPSGKEVKRASKVELYDYIRSAIKLVNDRYEMNERQRTSLLALENYVK